MVAKQLVEFSVNKHLLSKHYSMLMIKWVSSLGFIPNIFLQIQLAKKDLNAFVGKQVGSRYN